jgi:hypothetical protein
MTNLTALKRIADEETARKILGMIRGELDPREVSERCDTWVRACYHEPSIDEQIMEAANELLGTYGVEGYCSEDGRRGASFCNSGDSYTPELWCIDGRFTVTTKATVIERRMIPVSWIVGR